MKRWLLFLPLAACSSQPAQPCAADTSFASDRAPVHEEFAYDGDGNRTKWIYDDGTDPFLYTARFRDGVAEHEEWAGFIVAHADTTVANGHPQVTTLVDDSNSDTSTQTYTWNGDDLEGWSITFGDGVAMTLTTTPTAVGYNARTCASDCWNDVFEGRVEFVGDTEHYDHLTRTHDDGSLDQKVDRTFDDHGFLVEEVHTNGSGVWEDVTWDRDDDGAPRVMTTRNLTDAGASSLTTYAYRCEE